MLSVTPDATANAPLQAAPPWPSRSNSPPGASDLFGSLVNQKTQNDPPAPSPQSAPHNASDSPPPPPDHATAPNGNAPDSQATGDCSNAVNNAQPSCADGDAATPPGSAPADGTSQSTTTKTCGTTQAADQKPKDKLADADSTTTVDASILTLQVGNVTPTPVAVVIPATAPTTNVPAPASTGCGLPPPLAIAAAAIASSSQPFAPPPAPSDPTKTDSTTTPATAGTAAPRTAAPTPGFTMGLQPTASTLADPPAVTTTVAGTVPVIPKTPQGKSQGASGTTDSPAANSAPPDPDAGGTTTAAVQNGAAPQPSAAGRQETANTNLAGAAADATTAAPAPAAAAHDHMTASSTHAAADLPDPTAQAINTVQPQTNSASTLISASNVSVTAASNGAVPLSGLALEIVASVKGGKSSFEIRLDPADLGRIDVRVDIDRNGQVTSHLTVEKPETLSMLRQDAPQLQQALDDAGLKTGNGGLQFSLRDQSSSGQNGGSGSNPNAQRLIISDDDAVPASVAGRSYGRSISSSGGVDIRV